MSSSVDDLRAAKAELRARMRAMLAALGQEQRAASSRAACGAVLGTAWLRDARCVLAFLSLPHELDTAELVREILRAGKRLLVPRVDPGRRAMHAVAIQSLEDVRPGHFGVREPVGGALSDPAEIDVIVVPGLAFDRGGGRLGQGAGYYDRYLGSPGLSALTCGLCFSTQVVPAVPAGPSDRRVGWLATEAGVVQMPAG